MSSRELNSPDRSVTYGDLWGILLPLAGVMLLINLTQIVMRALLARFEDATTELAALGVGMYLMLMIWAACLHMDQMVLAHASNRRALTRVMIFGAVLGGSLGLLALAVGAVPSLSRFVILTLQRAPDEAVYERVAWFLVVMSPMPFLESVSRVMRGALIRSRRTAWVTAVYASSRAMMILVALAIVGTDFVRERPLWLLVIPTYADGLTRLTLYGFVASRVVWPRLPESPEPAPSVSRLFSFQYPLMVTGVTMAMTRPIAHAIIGPMDDGKVAIAALAVAMPLTHMICGVTADIRVLVPSFHTSPGGLERVRRFSTWLTAGLFGVGVLLFATPVTPFILREIIGVPPDLLEPSRSALYVCCLYPVALALRNYAQGSSAARHQTRAMTLSGPARLSALVLSLPLLTAFGLSAVYTATLAMLAAFIVEGAVIYFFLWRFRVGEAARRARAEAASLP